MDEMEEILKEYIDVLVRKQYSQNTQNIYYTYFKDFCMHFKKEELSTITAAQIDSYMMDLIQSKNCSMSRQKQRLNAIKFYYEKVLGREKQQYKLRRPEEGSHIAKDKIKKING